MICRVSAEGIDLCAATKTDHTTGHEKTPLSRPAAAGSRANWRPEFIWLNQNQRTENRATQPAGDPKGQIHRTTTNGTYP